MIRSRLANRWIYATGCLVALAASVLLHAYLVMTIPLDGDLGSADYDFQELLARNSIIEYLGAGGLGLILPIAWVALCVLITVWQRGQEERYDGWILLSSALAILGGAMAIDGATTAMHFSDYRPIGLLQLSIGLMWLSALMGGARLGVLMLRKSRRRGRVWALFCAVWGGCFGWIVFSQVLHPNGPPATDDGIELMRIARESRDYPGFFDRSLRDWIDCSVNEQGQIRLDGELVWDPSRGDTEEALGTALRAARRGAGEVLGEVEPVLRLRADVDAPCDSVVRVLALCSARGTFIWKTSLAVSRRPDLQEGAPDTYGISAYLADTRGTYCPSPPFDSAPEELVIRMQSGTGSLAFEYGDLRTADVQELRSELRARFDGVKGEGKGGLELYVRTQVIDGKLKWGRLLSFLIDQYRREDGAVPYIAPGRFRLLDE